MSFFLEIPRFSLMIVAAGKGLLTGNISFQDQST